MPSDQVQTLKRAFILLDCFTLEHPELGVREVARMVNLSSSTTGRLLAAMKEAGILSQNPVTRVYLLGPKVLAWAGVYTNTLDIRAKAIGYLHELHLATRETISLYILDGNDRVCVERLESPRSVRITSRVGLRLPLYAGSAGKAMLAFLPPARQKEVIHSSVLVPLTEKTIVDPDALCREIEKIRKEGYAVSRGEWLLDASGVAAPIFDQSGVVTAAVTISGPAQRFTDEAIAQYIPMILPVAAQISRELGYRGPLLPAS
jgi:DNA-binding IclR family transcriptional regulator